MTDSVWAEAAASVLREKGYPAEVRTSRPNVPREIPAAPFLWIETKSARLAPLGMGQGGLLRAEVSLGLRAFSKRAEDCLPLFVEAARLIGGVSDCGRAAFADGCFSLEGSVGLTLWLDGAEIAPEEPEIILDWKGELTHDFT